MIDRVRADGDQRVGGKLGDFRPAHAQLVAERAQLHPVPAGEIADDVAQLFLGLAAAQPPIERVEQMSLLIDAAAAEAAILIVDDETDAFLAGEAPREIAGFKPAMHLVERDELDARAANGLDHRLQELGRHLQQAVRLEAIAATRAHVRQGQDHADPADERAQPEMASGKIQRLEPGADDGLSRSHSSPLYRLTMADPSSRSPSRLLRSPAPSRSRSARLRQHTLIRPRRSARLT